MAVVSSRVSAALGPSLQFSKQRVKAYSSRESLRILLLLIWLVDIWLSTIWTITLDNITIVLWYVGKLRHRKMKLPAQGHGVDKGQSQDWNLSLKSQAVEFWGMWPGTHRRHRNRRPGPAFRGLTIQLRKVFNIVGGASGEMSGSLWSSGGRRRDWKGSARGVALEGSGFRASWLPGETVLLFPEESQGSLPNSLYQQLGTDQLLPQFPRV